MNQHEEEVEVQMGLLWLELDEDRCKVRDWALGQLFIANTWMLPSEYINLREQVARS